VVEFIKEEKITDYEQIYELIKYAYEYNGVSSKIFKTGKHKDAAAIYR
jgi:hypothetical protein